MTVEEFINQELCPKGVVTVWDETILGLAYQLGDLDKLVSHLAVICKKAGVKMRTDLTLQ